MRIGGLHKWRRKNALRGFVACLGLSGPRKAAEKLNADGVPTPESATLQRLAGPHFSGVTSITVARSLIHSASVIGLSEMI